MTLVCVKRIMSTLGQSFPSESLQYYHSIQGELEEEGDPQGEVRMVPSNLFLQPSHLSLQGTVKRQTGYLLFCLN